MSSRQPVLGHLWPGYDPTIKRVMSFVATQAMQACTPPKPQGKGKEVKKAPNPRSNEEAQQGESVVKWVKWPQFPILRNRLRLVYALAICVYSQLAVRRRDTRSTRVTTAPIAHSTCTNPVIIVLTKAPGNTISRISHRTKAPATSPKNTRSPTKGDFHAHQAQTNIITVAP